SALRRDQRSTKRTFHRGFSRPQLSDIVRPVSFAWRLRSIARAVVRPHDLTTAPPPGRRPPPGASRRAPQAPDGFDVEALVVGFFWFQRWEVFDGVFTPGGNLIAQLCADLELHEDLSGRRVLDVGAWNGCLSFECERRGAREVVALGPEDPAATG